MASPDRSLWIVFNGEVYNYVELRAELVGRGYHFRSTSDTEVILHGYEAWGPACLERFNGMFAFALWDARRRRLFCARDRLGVKPFYYHLGAGRFVFASEIKALFADPAVSREPDLHALSRFLCHAIQDDEAGTSFRAVRQLPAGHSLSIEPEARAPGPPVPWWSLPRAALRPAPRPEQAARRVRELIEDAVRVRLRSDVPVGTCLSGGLDSSTIACLASAQLKAGDSAARLRTFSARSEDPRIDEGRFLERVVEATGAEAHSVYSSGADFVANLERVVWHQEEPFHAPTVFAQYEVMRLARETGVTVLLDGQAGDELFGGYYYFVPPHLADLVLRGRWRRFAKEWAGHRRLHTVDTRRLAGDVLRAALPVGALRLLRSGLALGRGYRNDTPWAAPALRAVSVAPCDKPRGGRNLLHSWLRYAAVRSPLPNYLHHEDRNSMAWSIEARTPLLDYRLVEYVTGLAGEHKITAGWTKAVLREAMRGVLPEPVRLRADKQGFSIPQHQWFRHEAADLMRDLLTGGPTLARGWIDRAWARRAAEDLVAGRPVDETLVWRCASLEIWARVMLDRPLRALLTPPTPVRPPRGERDEAVGAPALRARPTST